MFYEETRIGGGLVLIGCVDRQQPAPAPARDLFLGPVFARRRAYAEASGRPWFILSSRWGLVRPDELIAPYRFVLDDQPIMFRRTWGRYVAEQLAVAARLDRGTTVEVHADDEYVDSVRSSLAFLELTVIEVDDVGAMADLDAGDRRVS